MSRHCWSNIQEDPYIAEIARRSDSHRFLGKATGLVYQLQIRELVALVGRLPASDGAGKILDWGCGKDHISHLLRVAGFAVTSCDLVSTVPDSAFAQETPILTEQAIGVVPLYHETELPFASSSFEAVTSFGVLEHVSNDSLSLAEIHLVLVPGGYFYCTFLPYRWSWTQFVSRLRGDAYHDRLYTERSIVTALLANGLAPDVVKHSQLLPKNSFPRSLWIERIDDLLCSHTPLRYLATNLVVVARRVTSRDAA
jgi:SAM-dependent methyltransferase